MKVGVFDSGIGGLSVANAIKIALPDIEVVFRNDSKHVPYGSRTPEEVLGFVVPIFQNMVDEGCEIIVVACNTVTTTLIGDLRERFKVPLIGIEPMVKPAAEKTESKIIAVCATPTTLDSQRYAVLKNSYAQDIQILEPDCSDWSLMIESGTVNQETIAARINKVLDDGADVIVLACTHYHWIETEIKELSKGRAEVLQPEEAIIRQLTKVISQL